MAAKGLSRISQSRERFLLEKGGGDDGANALGPMGNLVSGLRVFVRIQEGQPIEEVVEIIKNIELRWVQSLVVAIIMSRFTQRR